MRRMQTQFVNAQLALFFESAKSWARADEALLAKEFSDITGGQNNFNSAVPEQILDFPVLSLSSADGRLLCNFARGRVDLTLDGAGVPADQDARSRAVGLFERFFEAFRRAFPDVKVARVGFVMRGFVENIKLAPSVLSLDSFKSAHDTDKFLESTVRYVTRESIDGAEINNWTRLETAPYLGKKGTWVERDVNTVLGRISEPLDSGLLSKILNFNSEEVWGASIVKAAE